MKTATIQVEKILQTNEFMSYNVQCANCGNGDALCARVDREFIIGFPVHGVTKKKAQRVIEIFKAGS